VKERGLIHVFTGDGKGKTTAAMGQAVRAVGRGFKVLIVQFVKQVVSGEVIPLRNLGVEIYPMGVGYVGILGDHREKREHIQVARKALNFVKKKISEGSFDLLILDEVNVAVSLGLLNVEEVTDFLENKPKNLNVILTGRGAPKEFVKVADLVSEVREVKHPFKKGVEGRRGIEF